jgi:hypothetical protein
MKLVRTTGIAVLSIALATIGCKDVDRNTKKEGATTQEEHPHSTDHSMSQANKATFKDPGTKEVFQHYIHLKTALVNSDSEEASTGAKMLGETTGDPIVKAIAGTIMATRDLEAQRAAFEKLTVPMEALLVGELESGELYKQYCPMAFNNKGASWLSQEKEIKNPYFGDRMLSCGKVTETLR